MIVAKFGGTSMATATQIRKACDIMLADSNRRIMVVSAPGKRFSGDIKTTDLLIALAISALNGEDLTQKTKAVIDRYKEIIIDLGIAPEFCAEIEDDIAQRLKKTSLGRAKFLDLMKASGEDNCAKVVAKYLQSINIDAEYINPRYAGMMLSGKAGNAHIMPESYSLLADLKHKTGISVFPGFFGYNPQGEVVTFSRGGSDITGSILSASVNASVYENFTDVDNVYALDPRIVKNPAPITEITYWQIRELAYAGFNVFHEEAVEPVVKARIPIHIKNTNNPSATGTKIVYSKEATTGGVIAIAGTGGFCNLTISKFLMNREIGFGRRLFQILEEEGISFDHAPSGIDNISPIFRQDQLDEETLSRLIDRIRKELNVDSIELTKDIALVVVVGQTPFSTRASVATAIKCLSSNGINVSVLNMSSSSLSLTIGIAEKDLEKALKTLYYEFFPQS